MDAIKPVVIIWYSTFNKYNWVFKNAKYNPFGLIPYWMPNDECRMIRTSI